MSTQNFDFKLVTKGPDLKTEKGQLIASAMSSDFTFDQDIEHAEEIKRRWNSFPALEQKNRELVTLLGQLNEQLNSPARNTTVTSHRRDGSVIISHDLREAVRQSLTERSGQ